MCKLTYGFNTGIPLNILIIYGKDPNFNKSKFITISGMTVNFHAFPIDGYI